MARTPLLGDHHDDMTRECDGCGDLVDYLSSRDLCDGCEAELGDGVIHCPCRTDPTYHHRRDRPMTAYRFATAEETEAWTAGNPPEGSGWLHRPGDDGPLSNADLIVPIKDSEFT